MERKIEQGEELFLTFIDLRAAFDTVHRESIWKCLEDLETRREMIKIIKSIY